MKVLTQLITTNGTIDINGEVTQEEYDIQSKNNDKFMQAKKGTMRWDTAKGYAIIDRKHTVAINTIIK